MDFDKRLFCPVFDVKNLLLRMAMITKITNLPLLNLNEIKILSIEFYAKLRKKKKIHINLGHSIKIFDLFHVERSFSKSGFCSILY